ncbi:hypothetical protein [Achromobacter sp. DH1f]|uniref:hypothetical protein n=1 Tax=Achromobacter sp. DH1f TaxID=1397275 RepID=UPI0012FE936F|nr:hypothetical protein [Achromobacter sp. DH1f]
MINSLLTKGTAWKQVADVATKGSGVKSFKNANKLSSEITRKLSLKNTFQMRGADGYRGASFRLKSGVYVQKRAYTQNHGPEFIQLPPGVLSIKSPKTTLPIVYDGPVSQADARGQASRSLADLAQSTHRLRTRTDVGEGPITGPRSTVEGLRDVTDAALPGWLQSLGALDEQGELTPLGQAVMDHINKGLSDDPDVNAAVRALGSKLAAPLREAGMSDKEAGARLADRVLQACRNFANELGRSPQMAQDADLIHAALDKAESLLAGIKDSLAGGKDPSGKEVRALYNVMNKQVSASIEMAGRKALTQLTDLLPSMREKLNLTMVSSDVRSLTRHFARQLGDSTMMALTTARDYLHSLKSPMPSGHGPRFHAIANNALAKPGATVDSVLDDTQGSAKRTNAGVNQRFDPESPKL